MLLVLLTLILYVVVSLAARRSWHKKRISSEMFRKILHITHGLIAVTWPFLVSYQLIIVIEVAFIIVVGLDRKVRLFDGPRAVARRTWGEFFFPLGIISVALIRPNKWIFVAAVLHLGVADAAAALVGSRWGKKNRYHIFGQEKSVAGTLAFYLVSVAIASWLTLITPSGLHDVAPLIIGWLPIATTCIENLGVFGSDNLLVPLLLAVVLKGF